MSICLLLGSLPLVVKYIRQAIHKLILPMLDLVRMRATLASDKKREPRATRHQQVRAPGSTGSVAEAAGY